MILYCRLRLINKWNSKEHLIKIWKRRKNCQVKRKYHYTFTEISWIDHSSFRFKIFFSMLPSILLSLVCRLIKKKSLSEDEFRCKVVFFFAKRAKLHSKWPKQLTFGKKSVALWQYFETDIQRASRCFPWSVG